MSTFGEDSALEPYILRTEFENLEDFLKFILIDYLENWAWEIDKSGFVCGFNQDIGWSTIHFDLLKHAYENQLITIDGISMVVSRGTYGGLWGKNQLLMKII